VTLKIFTTRIYVVTSGELIQAVFRNSKAITFEPIANAGSERVFAISKPKMEALLKHEGDSKDSTMAKTTGGMHTSLLPGPKLLEMNSRALDTFAVFLENIDSDGKAINLHAWVRDCFTLSSAEAVYGHDNPIANDHSLIQSLEYLSCSPIFTYITNITHSEISALQLDHYSSTFSHPSQLAKGTSPALLSQKLSNLTTPAEPTKMPVASCSIATPTSLQVE
jgi:hypothetical protein